jgi:hypothetical protein
MDFFKLVDGPMDGQTIIMSDTDIVWADGSNEYTCFYPEGHKDGSYILDGDNDVFYWELYS